MQVKEGLGASSLGTMSPRDEGLFELDSIQLHMRHERCSSLTNNVTIIILASSRRDISYPMIQMVES